MWAEGSLLEQLPNGGAVVALIAVIVLFHKRQERSEDALRGVVDTFAAEVAAARAEYRAHIDGIMRMGLDAHHETRDAIRALDATLGKFPNGAEREG